MPPSICLNMIVKNEAPVIKRCLATVKPWITSWVISDTGSDDGTQDIIKEYMKDMPGKLIERPWVDFAHNRNEVLEIAKKMGDFSFFIDADERFLPDSNIKELPTEQDFYTVRINEKVSFYERIFLFRNSKAPYWRGVLHEFLSTPVQCSRGFFHQGEILSITQDGNRFTDPDKYKKDAAVLEAALEKEPDNSRYLFYLGQSYKNAYEPSLSLQAYERRISCVDLEKDPDLDERFYSLFMIGALQEQLGFDSKICAESFLKAHKLRPYRHEPLYGIAIYYVKMKRFKEAYCILKEVMEFKYPDDSIFVQVDIRDLAIPFLFITCCYELGKYEECFKVGDELLKKQGLPEQMSQELLRNLSMMRINIKPLDILI